MYMCICVCIVHLAFLTPLPSPITISALHHPSVITTTNPHHHLSAHTHTHSCLTVSLSLVSATAMPRSAVLDEKMEPGHRRELEMAIQSHFREWLKASGNLRQVLPSLLSCLPSVFLPADLSAFLPYSYRSFVLCLSPYLWTACAPHPMNMSMFFFSPYC